MIISDKSYRELVVDEEQKVFELVEKALRLDQKIEIEKMKDGNVKIRIRYHLMYREK